MRLKSAAAAQKSKQRCCYVAEVLPRGMSADVFVHVGTPRRPLSPAIRNPMKAMSHPE